MKVSRKQLAFTTVAAGLLVFWLKPDSPEPGQANSGANHGHSRIENAKLLRAEAASQTIGGGNESAWKSVLFAELKRDLAGAKSQERLDAARKSVHQVPLDDISSALALIGEKYEPAQRGLIDTLLLERWAASAPSATVAWIDRNMSGTDRSNNLSRVSAIWAASDPSAAWDWARQLAKPEDRAAALTEAAYEIARQKPSIALSFADEFPESVSGDVVAQAASLMAEKSPQQALEAAAALITESLQQRATASVAVAWAEADPVSAGRLAVQSLPPGKIQDDAVIGVLQRWAQSEPAGAASWVSTFPAGALGDTAVDNLVKLWTDKDATATGKWVAQIADEHRRDIALAAYGEKLATRAPETAALWLAQIGNESLRQSQMENLLEIWSSHDPVAAEHWKAQEKAPPKNAGNGSVDATAEPSSR